MNWNCFIHGHEYVVLERYDYKNSHGDTIGKVIASRCSRCGRITCKTIIIVKEYVRQ